MAILLLNKVADTLALTGSMTMWTNSPTAIQGSSCGYADVTATAKGDNWQANYIDKSMYCAVSDKVWNGGQACGRCYKISFNGTGGTDQGRAGNAIIQVVDSGSAKEFDCYINAFKKVTGATTGVFPITYNQIACQASNATVVVLDGTNAWYVKVLVAGGTRGVKSVTITVGGKTYPMSRVVGATWASSLAGSAGGSAKFVVTYEDGTKRTLTGCFKGWPVPTGSQCKQ